jgi:hypothetical protein
VIEGAVGLLLDEIVDDVDGFSGGFKVDLLKGGVVEVGDDGVVDRLQVKVVGDEQLQKRNVNIWHAPLKEMEHKWYVRLLLP